MEKTHAFRVGGWMTGAVALGLALSGCTSGPTYGTDRSATEQLFSDLGSAVSLSNKREGPAPKYAPRPGLVTPAKGQPATLVAPQTALNDRKNNPNWAETPEEMRDRLKAEADANANNPNYRSPLLAGRGQAGTLTEEQKWEEFRKAKAEANPAAALQRRRYLSDPPSEFRQPAATATADDLGEPEEKKAKRLRKQAQADGQKSNWWNPFN